jgi:hypothetical protein
VEVVQHEPLHGWIEEVGEREAESGPRRLQVFASKPEHGERAQPDDGGLDDEEE